VNLSISAAFHKFFNDQNILLATDTHRHARTFLPFPRTTCPEKTGHKLRIGFSSYVAFRQDLPDLVDFYICPFPADRTIIPSAKSMHSRLSSGKPGNDPVNPVQILNHQIVSIPPAINFSLSSCPQGRHGFPATMSSAEKIFSSVFVCVGLWPLK